MTECNDILIEEHPWGAFVPEEAKVLIAGTFPPPRTRWSMDFFYPNRTNDFWPMMGLIFCGDRRALLTDRGFNLSKIKQLLEQKGIAMSDTGRRVRRLRGNASDKFLDIVEPMRLCELLQQMPQCRAVASTGQKAAEVLAALTDTAVPAIGDYAVTAAGLEVWRMPSTSRAYPLALEKKAIPYAAMFRHLGLL